ncbi:MAG TPA: HAD family hydrolase [Bryobacteraceae bacterium]|jgi:putative hydrolase of the HAD superfamily|nr:HAD family hydrolase [Bryobacteraceae bacterium]
MAAESLDSPAGLNLLIDADDTLWENNIYFERAFEEFCAFLSHSRLAPPEIRTILDEIEIVNSQVHGYGALNFGRNLRQCFDRLVEREINDEDYRTVHAFAERILDHPMNVIPGVPETLGYLAQRHRLILFTKGHPDEQQMKVDRSGLASYFSHTAIVKEKNAGAYRGIVETLRLDSTRTWMVGNSPKSDINPALAAGLGAVFIPHDHTWTLERESVAEGSERLITLTAFKDLRSRF